MSADVCYVISNGFSARMILHSAVVAELGAVGHRVALVTPAADESGLQALAEELGIADVAAAPAPELARRFLSGQIQNYLFQSVEENAALYAKYLRATEPEAADWSRWTHRVLLGLSRAARRWPELPRVAGRAQRSLLRSGEIAAALAAIKPKLVVATYPVNAVEAATLCEARRAGMTTAIHLLSWDNITCKGRFPITADYYLSWGPVMTAELEEVYRVGRDRIFECGVPHFDAHYRAREDGSGRALLERIGLDPAAPTLLFGMSSPYFAPREIDIVEWLAREVAVGRFGERTQLIVRPHPQNVTGGMSDQSWLPRLDRIRGQRVAVDYPAMSESKLSWNLDRDDLAHLGALFEAATVTLNSGSTFSIDALCHDRPVIMTPFDGDDTGLPWHRSARRVVEYPHLEKLLGYGGVRVASDYAALGGAIRDYLADPARDRRERAEALQAECGSEAGGASRRVAHAIDAICSRV